MPDLIVEGDIPKISFTTRPFAPRTGQKFFIEVLSGTGRLSDTIREMYPDVFVIEVGFLEQGCHRDLLGKSTFAWIMGLARRPGCVGVCFGFPCGTFSSARRWWPTPASRP